MDIFVVPAKSIRASLLLVTVISMASLILTGNTPAFGQGRGQIRSRVNLKAGTRAPEFDLITRDGKYKVRLSSYRTKKPVVLIFGSYT